MKKNSIFWLSVVAIALSLVAIIFSMFRWNTIDVEYASFFGWTTAALSMITMVLIVFIGGQHIIGKRVMEKEIEKAKKEMQVYSDTLVHNHFLISKFSELKRMSNDSQQNSEHVEALINALRSYEYLSGITYNTDKGFEAMRKYKYRNYAQVVESMLDEGFREFDKKDIENIKQSMQWMYKESANDKNDHIREDIYTMSKLMEKMEEAVTKESEGEV